VEKILLVKRVANPDRVDIRRLVLTVPTCLVTVHRRGAKASNWSPNRSTR
jgi:hypothetical protein